MGDLLKVGEAAEKLSVSKDTIRGWLRQGKLKGLKINGWSVRIPASEIDRLKERWKPQELDYTQTPQKPPETPPDNLTPPPITQAVDIK